MFLGGAIFVCKSSKLFSQKRSIIDVWHGPKYVSGDLKYLLEILTAVLPNLHLDIFVIYLEHLIFPWVWWFLTQVQSFE